MNVALKPELEQFVTDKLNAGQYKDASAVINRALEVLREREQLAPARKPSLRAVFRRRIKQLEVGEYSDVYAEKIIADERARLTGGSIGD